MAWVYVCGAAMHSTHEGAGVKRHRRRRLVVLAAAFAAAAFVATAPASGFSPEVVASVVSVLPERPTDQPLPERPEGSGVAVLPGGYVATNGHVIGRAARIRLRLADGRVVAATIVGRDPATDIALLRAPVDLPVPALAPEPALGAPVCAVGNPFGLGLSVSCGVVSALRRTGTGFNAIENFIQTDAAVNPGGSGGALIDAEGRLVGLVSAIFTKRSDANIGVNFAASAALVMRVVEDLAEYGRVIRGKSGLRVADLDDDGRATLTGARVIRVAPESAAEAAGLEAGGIVVAIAGRAIRRASDVTGALHLHRVGEPIEIVYLRGGARHATTLRLAP